MFLSFTRRVTLRVENHRVCLLSQWSKDKLTLQEISQKPLSKEQMSIAAQADSRYRSHHMEVEKKLTNEDFDIVRRKRMIYRSKQRGWLEADLLLGSWAVENIPKLSKDELDEFELLLKEETIDIFNYISGKDELPPHLANLDVMIKIKDYAYKSGMESPEGYDKKKRDANLT